MHHFIFTLLFLFLAVCKYMGGAVVAPKKNCLGNGATKVLRVSGVKEF